MSPRRGRYFPKTKDPLPLFDSFPRRDDTSVSFTVMAHPKRKEWAEELARDIGCDITWDQRNDRHDTGLRAIRAHGVNVTHHVVVQDDVHLCQDFRETVEEMVRYADPYAPIGLYYGAKGKASSRHSMAHEAAVSAGAVWLARPGPVWGPGIIYPVATIPDLVKYFSASIVENYDRRVMKYYESVGKSCWYSVPSLVDHRQEGNPSLCGHDRGNRQSRMFIGPQSGLNVEWSGPVLRSQF